MTWTMTPEGVLVFVHEGASCAKCRVFAFFFLNRLGSTVCVGCCK